MTDYSQELSVNFESMVVNSDGSTQVTIFIRGTKKTLTTTDTELKEGMFMQGEKVKLYYSNPASWTLKKYIVDSPVDKYFRTD